MQQPRVNFTKIDSGPLEGKSDAQARLVLYGIFDLENLTSREMRCITSLAGSSGRVQSALHAVDAPENISATLRVSALTN